MLKIYIASKFKHGERWNNGLEFSRFDLVSRWITHYAGQVPDEPQFCKIGWIHDLEDVARADALVVYAESGEHLCGALVEVGAALALGKHVVLVGEHPDWGTWQYHPLVHKVLTVDAAEQILECMEWGKY